MKLKQVKKLYKENQNFNDDDVADEILSMQYFLLCMNIIF
jgi:hypothetical protein